ncbi:Transposase [Cordylochernes scorpioides]|uniref:Transposase n=1 Tax=Cordylochernes scorpioides TaxID=51811 RepID=A0ABY6KYC3_9ARAC|nr:Transposase [Cordylochernes scorpioides]
MIQFSIIALKKRSELECFVIIEEVRHFNNYLDKPFQIVTDHNALKWLLLIEDFSAIDRLAICVEFSEGDQVLRIVAKHHPCMSKLSPRKQGPFFVKKKISSLVYDIQDTEGRMYRFMLLNFDLSRTGTLSTAINSAGRMRAEGEEISNSQIEPPFWDFIDDPCQQNRVTSARVDRRILRQAVAAPQATCTAILQHVQDTLDHFISTITISRRLVANGLHSCRPLRRLPLTPPNRRQRLEWCRARSTWMTEWHRVVFSDESRFCLSSDSRRVRVWRRRGERSNLAAIEVPNALYQQDNARPHTARISQQALQDVQMLPWPPYSPDLSPIEHVWDIIGRRLHALPQPRSEDELWQMVEREWRAIPQDAIRTLIDSLPRRVAACIAVRGGPTCY